MTDTSATTGSAVATPTTARLALTGIGLACASLLVAARGGAASGSVAPIVMSGALVVVVLGASAAAALDRRWLRRHHLDVGWALGLTLGLFGTTLGWLGSSVGRGSLPSWPLSLLAAAVVAVPCVVAAARTGDRR